MQIDTIIPVLGPRPHLEDTSPHLLGCGGLSRVYAHRIDQAKATKNTFVAYKTLLSDFVEEGEIRIKPYHNGLLRVENKKGEERATLFSQVEMTLLCVTIQEYLNLATLRGHKNIVEAYDFRIIKDRENRITTQMEMERINGPSLRDVLTSPNDTSVIGSIISECAQGLIYAQQKGVVHGDIKPENVLLDEKKNRAKLVDFSNSWSEESKGFETQEPLDTLLNYLRPLSKRQGVVCTPGYASPEQAHGEQITSATDNFSLALVLYEGLVGTRAFGSTDDYWYLLSLAQKYQEKDRDVLVANLEKAGFSSPNFLEACRRALDPNPHKRGEISILEEQARFLGNCVVSSTPDSKDVDVNAPTRYMPQAFSTF